LQASTWAILLGFFMIPLMLMKDKTALSINKKQFLQLLVLGSTGIFAYSFFFSME
jgi:hypothetical protein